MDKKIAGLIGAMATLASVDMAQAATPSATNPTDVVRAQSYAELLAPIPNAVALLNAADTAKDEAAQATAGGVQEARYYRHHHHHHHRYRRHHHHHHHHHHRYRR
jgi:hypothetical protein